MRLRYSDRAKVDVEVALAWYEKQRRGLGFEFLDCVEVAIRAIIKNSERYPIRYRHFRGCLVRRFPFIVFYTVGDDEIVVHSVFHQRQDPERRP